MSEHTKGRLAVKSDWLIPADQTDRPIGGAVNKERDRNHYANIVATVSDKYHDQAANARRLAACWNKCEGLETADLETGLSLVDICAKSNGYQVRLADAQKELAAARALLREVLNDPDRDELSRHLTRRIESYLDACDTLEGKPNAG